MNYLYHCPTVLHLYRFLHQQGIRLKPWRTQDQILESLYCQLADERHGDAFWGQLRDFARALVLDLHQRQPDSELVAAMALEPAVCIDDIRAALTKVRKEPGGFRTLNRLLPQASLGLLLAVSLSAVGCGGVVDDDGRAENRGTGGGSQATQSGGNLGQGGSAAAAGGSSYVGQGGASAGGVGAGAVGGSDGSGGCSALPVSVAAIFDACGIDPEYKGAYLAALADCDSSWAEGMGAFFSCMNCEMLTQYLENCYEICPPGMPYSESAATECLRPQPMYLVVVSRATRGPRSRRDANGVFESKCVELEPKPV